MSWQADASGIPASAWPARPRAQAEKKQVVTIEERLEKLEREVVQGQGGGIPTIIRANCFVLEDGDGQCRAALDVGKDGSRLVLCDENGNTRAGLAVFNGESGLILFDAAGKVAWRAPWRTLGG